jgi:hypothetical protein
MDWTRTIARASLRGISPMKGTPAAPAVATPAASDSPDADTDTDTGKAAAPAAPAQGKRPRQVGRDAMKAMADAQHAKADEKLVRDSFSMPKDDYALIDLLKKRAAAAGRPTRKNELLRAGLHALLDSGRVELKNALDRLPVVKKRSTD